MSKEFKLQPIPSIEGGTPMRTPVVDSGGSVVITDGRVVMEEATLLTIFENIIRLFPVTRLTMANITSGISLKERLVECRKSASGYLVLEDAEYDWARSMLNDGEVGVKMFGFNLLNILKAVDEFEKEERE